MATSQVATFDAAAFLRTLGAGKTIARFGKNKSVFKQGDKADAVFYVQKGKIRISVLSKNGKEAVIAILGRGDFFGEGCLTTQVMRMATATTLTECLVLRLEKGVVLKALRNDADFSSLFISHLLARNVRIEEDLVDQLFNSSEKRLARLLLLLADFGKEGAPQEVLPRISQETLASMIGTTRSRVNAFMNKFRRLGFIEYNDRLEVHSSILKVILHD